MKKICITLALCLITAGNVLAQDYWCDAALYTPNMTESSFCKGASNNPMCKIYYQEAVKSYKNGTCKEVSIKRENVYGASCEIITDKKTNKRIAHKCTDSNGSINYAAMDKVREMYK